MSVSCDLKRKAIQSFFDLVTNTFIPFKSCFNGKPLDHLFNILFSLPLQAKQFSALVELLCLTHICFYTTAFYY